MKPLSTREDLAENFDSVSDPHILITG